MRVKEIWNLNIILTYIFSSSVHFTSFILRYVFIIRIQYFLYQLTIAEIFTCTYRDCDIIIQFCNICVYFPPLRIFYFSSCSTYVFIICIIYRYFLYRFTIVEIFFVLITATCDINPIKCRHFKIKQSIIRSISDSIADR